MSQQRPPLEEMTLRQLRKVASEYEVSRYSRMRKTELIDAIRTIDAQRGQIPAPSVVTSAAAAQTQVEASKFMAPDLPPLEALASVDEGLPDLPSGYGESRIVLMPRDPQWAYAYWDIPAEHKDDLRRQGGQGWPCGSMMSPTLTSATKRPTVCNSTNATKWRGIGICRFRLAIATMWQKLATSATMAAGWCWPARCLCIFPRVSIGLD